MGHVGTEGSRISQRISRYGEWGSSIAENIAYGSSNGAEYMIQLHIDDGVGNRGHRTTLMNPKLNLTGIAACPHGVYKYMLVAAYAGSIIPNGKTTSGIGAPPEETGHRVKTEVKGREDHVIGPDPNKPTHKARSKRQSQASKRGKVAFKT